MRYIRVALLTLAIWYSLSTTVANAIGEVFKVESSGTEYCGDFNAVKFGASTNVDLWVFIASETELIVR